MMQITLDSNEEHLLQVKGTSGTIAGAPAITSLTLVTNKTTYGPYGCVQGKRFQSSREGKVVGFFGQASTTLHQLGVITSIYALPGNGTCTRCTVPYLYCCDCTLQHSPFPTTFKHRPIETGVSGGGKTPGHDAGAVIVTSGTDKVPGDKPGKAPEPSKPAAERPIAPATEPGRGVVKAKDPVGAAGVVQV